ncbi:carbonic anhydrase [Desulfobulbus oligotrophicus]|uniref:Carbonic anhydrase n=1 Tax=Desulfobulbus oligotrophicus TaxID=1909699 RepID=A0A7T5VBW0_9BACT|nr:carbonic anhydrase [Desulfobulbus oligotrophicus]QQG64997.1 carbonic anhydrase [Desulfobulbus oligotrophicus]
MTVTKPRLSGREALEVLLTGNQRFVRGQLEHPNHCNESRKKLLDGQEPIAAILTCGDSRVPPVDIFDQGLGDLFVLRVGGGVISDHMLGSIEYAVAHLHTPLVMVMGHSSCGAINAASRGAKAYGHMATLIPPLATALKHTMGLEGNWCDNASKELARTTAKKIAESEPVIADMVAAGKVFVVATYYDMATGVVSVL